MTLPIRRSLTLTPTLTRLLPHRHPHRHPHIRTRRAYSDQKPHEAKQTSDLPWMIGALGLGGSAAWYLVHTGPEKKPHKGHDHHDGKTIHHETNTEQEEEDQQSEPAASAAAKEPEQSIARETQVAEARSQNPAVVDKAEAVKWAGGPSSTSGKQLGVDNANTSSPFTTRPGLSHKGETDADTAKLQGTVDRDRKQV